MLVSYALHVYHIHDVVWGRKFHSRVPDLYTRVRIGDIKDNRRTRTVKGNKSPHWDEILTFSSHETSTNLNIQIRHESNWSPDPCVGYVDITLADLLKKCENCEAQLSLSPPHGKETSTGTAGILHLRLEAIGTAASVEADVKTVVQDIERCGIVRSAEAADSTAVTAATAANGVIEQSEQNEMYEALGSLVAKLDAFVSLIDRLSKAHPYLNAAWQVTSALYKGVSKQFKTDKKLVDMVHTMVKAIELANHAESLPNKALYLEATIIELLKQITECCLFVRQYTSHGFIRRMADLDNSKKIDDFQQSLVRLRDALDSGNILYSAFVSSRTLNKIDTLFLRQTLNPIQEEEFGRPTCLPGTRVEIRNDITAWLLSDSSQNIFWLKGVAGSGKSTISTTVAEYFREMSRLGTFLFFEREKSKPSSVIPTIACALASLDLSIAKHVTAAVEQDNNIAKASAKVQFEKLLLGPLSSARAGQGPIIVILDALDECGTPQARKDLMRLLKEDFPKLPSQFRFLITSRPEPDIVKALSSRISTVRELELDYTSDASRNDVLSYIKAEMNELIRVDTTLKVPKDWPWEKNMKLLGKAAGGLFIYASTAVKLVSNSDNPFRKLEKLISDSQSVSRYGLDELYATVLRSSGIDWNDGDSKARFVQVLALLLLSKVSLSSETIDGLLGFSPTEPSDLILSRLQCLLAYEPGQPVKFFHASFSDYLLSPERRKDPWYIDISIQKNLFASRCFDVMEELLCFNICDIETSFLCNGDIPELDVRTKAKIPHHLEYACLYWTRHICDVPCTSDLLDQLSAFSHIRLLYWFEVLSLLKQFSNISTQALEAASAWAICNKETSTFLKDAARLCSIYTPCITQSVTHIYVSMLPLMKDDSIAAAHYSKQMDLALQVERRGVKAPLALIKVLQGHTGLIRSVNFSPDGKYIVFVSNDTTINVLDVQSEKIVLGPLAGHTSYVKSANFSPDGRRIVSCSSDKTIRIWDAESGKEIIGPLEGHTGSVTSVKFSPDGKHIVSGSGDKTLIVWDAESGKPVLGPLKGHTDHIRSVNFSPDGRFIVSGSDDKTIIVWNAESGAIVHGPLEKHTSYVMSVNFSPDGKHFVSGSCDGTIMVWGSENGKVVLGPLNGHTSSVNSVNFSPNCRRIVSGSNDRTIRVWDVESGEVVLGPLEGHRNWITSVNFSPDGKRIVSGSCDRTIRIWDAEGALGAFGPLEGHTSYVTSINISPDGKRIVSGSGDRTIRIWDAESGEAVLHPLEGHTSSVNSVNFSPDSKQIVSGSSDKTIIVWIAENGEAVLGPLERHTGSVTSTNFSTDGKCIVSGSGDRTIIVWDAKSGKPLLGPLKGHTDYIRSVNFSPDGRLIVSGSDDRTIIVWNAESGTIVHGPLQLHTSFVMSVNFSPDGKYIVSGSCDETIMVWDTESGQVVLGPLGGHIGNVNSVNFSPDCRRIVSCSNDKTIRVWDVNSGMVVLGPLEGHKNWITAVNFSPDGKHIVSGSCDRMVKIWDAQNGQVVFSQFKGNPDSVTSVNFSTDGKRIVSGSTNGTIRVIDAMSGEMILGPLREHTSAIGSVIFSPDGKLIVSGSDDRAIRVWNAETGELILGPLEEHADYIISINFTPDGKHIVSSSNDGAIKMWDAETGELILNPPEGYGECINYDGVSPGGKRTASVSDIIKIRLLDAESGEDILSPLEGHTGAIRSANFSSDGKLIVSGSDDRTIRVWDVLTPDAAALLSPGSSSSAGITHWTLSEDGWVKDDQGNLLLWIPHDLHKTLLRPRNTAIFNCAFSTRLDFSCAAMGIQWSNCFRPGV